MNILVGQEDYKFIDFICELTSIIGCEHLIKNEIEDAERHIEKLTKRIDKLRESIKVANENKNKITNNQYDTRTEGEI
ncbi:MAG: hypothetical protein ACRCXX_00025, partial [Cetobacterium sp.]|uniref:hypothetical protein n=1 Tax=Cetobacterium sp. TaxID=2071632 RepID=UPI003F2E3B4D